MCSNLILIAGRLKCIDAPAARLLGAKPGQKLCSRCYKLMKQATQEEGGEGKKFEEDYQPGGSSAGYFLGARPASLAHKISY